MESAAVPLSASCGTVSMEEPITSPEAAHLIVSDEDESDNENCETLSGLSEVELCVLRELETSVVFKVINEMKLGTPLLAALEKLAPSAVIKVQRALEGQYADADQESWAKTNPSVGDAQLDSTIREVVGGVSNTSSGGALNEEALLRMARVTPLRLSYEERSFLRLLESTLEVSEYTDKVDVIGNRYPAAKRMGNEIKQICAVLSGLVVAHKYEAGQRLIRERDFKANVEFFRTVFEIGRRYKILNPERMRDSYGKLIYFLMDTRNPSVAEQLEFDCVAPVKTVWSLLSQKKNGLRLLRDPLIRLATAEIDAEGKTRSQIQWEIREKENAVRKLVRTYATVSHSSPGLLSRFTANLFRGNGSGNEDETGTLSTSKNGMPTGAAMDGGDQEFTPDEVEQCLYSLSDHNTFLRFNRQPCDKMIAYLKRYFRPQSYEQGFNLAITCGQGGARLSHSHERQYLYVLQSLTLWKEVLHDMLGLWCLAEKDLLAPHNPYALRDTGQGLNRVQEAPHVYRSMYTILARVQERVGGWCGSSVIHLGDHNVPNALQFIDKYLDVPRILGPVVLCLDKIPALYASSSAMKQYINEAFGSCELLIKTILVDFFRHAFDGSGADNFYDAGSCIDGRLTSAWNWCSRIEKKSYFPIFLLTGFSGFDGRF